MNKKEAIALLAGKSFTKKGFEDGESAIVTRFEDTQMHILYNDGCPDTEVYGKKRHYTILGDAVNPTDELSRPYTFAELAKQVKKGTVLVYGNVKKNGVRYGKAITGISTHQLFKYGEKWYNTTELFNKFFLENGKPFGVNP